MSEPSFSKDTPDSFDLDSCVSKLNFISTIPENNKPCYNTNTYISKNAWFVRIRRRWAGEEGQEGVDYVNKVLDSCDRNYRMCLNSENNANLTKLRTALKNSVPGFDNLIRTYSDQKSVEEGYQKCKIRVTELIQSVQIPKPRKIKGLTSYFSGWDDDYDNYDDYESDIEKKPENLRKNTMTLSLVISETSSSKSFFNSNDMVLLKPNKRND